MQWPRSYGGQGERVFVALTPLLALLATGAITGIVKDLVERQRPPTILHLVTETGASFPSGHSGDSSALLISAALVIAAACAHTPTARILIVLIATAAATAIGASRVILGVHYPTDVLAGLLLGSLCALTLTTAALLLRQRVAVATPKQPHSRALRTTQATIMAQRDIGELRRGVSAFLGRPPVEHST